MDDENIIFLSYASPDRDRVLEFYRSLKEKGFDTWMDKEKIVAGQNWDFEIKKALSKAKIIVVFLSRNSVNRRGYCQREIRVALDVAQNKLVDDIYIVPVLLDDVEIPEQLKDIHVIRSEADAPEDELASAVKSQFERLNVESTRLQGDSKVRWTTNRYGDAWDGLPGYDSSYQLLRFSSDEFPNVTDITDVIRGWLVGQVMSQRLVKFAPEPERCGFGRPRFFRENTWEATCGSPTIKERMISITYSVFTMYAGAAHPNQFFKTFVFSLDPVTHIMELQDVFEDTNEAFELIQREVRHSLLHDNDRFKDDPSEMTLDPEYVNSGTAKWADFNNFTFSGDGIDLLFSTYQVGPYVFGPQFATIKYEKIFHLLRDHYVLTLGIEHLRFRRPTLPVSEAAANS